MKTDVIIVGAGPTGLSLAAQLIRYGVDFVILDKKEGITPYSKALGVQARTLEIYEQIGIADKLIAEGTRAEKVRLAEGGEVRGELELANIGEDLSPYPFLLIVEQSRHELILSEYLTANGTEIRWNTDLESFTQDEQGVRANVRDADGMSLKIEAKFLVGCDGAKSPVRGELGLKFEGSTFDRLFYVADVQIDWVYSHDALMICLAKNTIAAFFPMVGEKRYRIVGTFPENEDRREGDILYDEIERKILEDTKLELDISHVNWFSVYRVHSRRVNKFSSGRCFLAGDSAHIHTPAGAQGMNTGIQDAYNLAWKLAMVIEGKAGAGLLETYNEERLANAKRLLQTTDRLFDFGASEDVFVAFFRTQIFPYLANLALSIKKVREYIFPIVSQIGINYRNSSLSATEGVFKVRAGDRMPYFKFEDVSIYEKLKDPKFHLISFFDGRNEPPDYSQVAKPDLVDCHRLTLYPHIAEIFGRNESFVVLLRPDNYIGLISENAGPKQIEEYLKRI